MYACWVKTDLILYFFNRDFEGKVKFMPFPLDRKFTVLVFAKRERHEITFQDGLVELTYAVNTTRGDRFGLNLLDAGDFYGKKFFTVTVLHPRTCTYTP